MGRMGSTTRGSQKVSALPVAQHIPPPRLKIASRAAVSGGGEDCPFSVTWKRQIDSQE